MILCRSHRPIRPCRVEQRPRNVMAEWINLRSSLSFANGWKLRLEYTCLATPLPPMSTRTRVLMEVRCASVVQITSMSIRVFIMHSDPAIVTFVACMSVLNQHKLIIEDILSLEQTQDRNKRKVALVKFNVDWISDSILIHVNWKIHTYSVNDSSIDMHMKLYVSEKVVYTEWGNWC